MKNKKMDQEYSFALRPASIEEVGLFYSNDEQDEALGTVGHLRLDFGHGFLPLRSTCYPHNDDQFNTLEFKMLLREFLEAMQDNGPLASLSSMEAYCQKHGGAITEDEQTYHKLPEDALVSMNLWICLGNRAISFLPSLYAQSV